MVPSSSILPSSDRIASLVHFIKCHPSISTPVRLRERSRGVVRPERFGSPRKGIWNAFCGRALLYCKIQFCDTRKQYGLIPESLQSGCFTNQPNQPKTQHVFHFQLSETKRKQFAFGYGDAEIKRSWPIDIKGDKVFNKCLLEEVTSV